MEFWGIEIKPGMPLMVEPEDGYIIHVSQVTIGDLDKVKKDENVPVYVKNGEDKQKFVIGTLSQKFPQVSLDLFFVQEFEISHNSKSSVFLLGYKDMDVQDEEIDSDSELEEYMGQQYGALPPNGMNNEIKPEEDESDSVEEEDESDSGEEDDESESDEMGSDKDEDEDESDEEDVEDEAPLKVEPPSKKILNGKATNNTVASKKAKVAFQNKSSGGKKKCPFPCGSSCKK